jgi:hypothetical protein
MPALLTFRPRTRQPSATHTLNQSHPLYSQVRVACAFNRDFFDYKRQKTYAHTGTSNLSFKGTDTDGGLMLEFGGASVGGLAIRTDNGVATGFSNLVPSGSLLWIVIRFRINSLGTRRAIFADFSAAGTNFSCRFEQQAANTYLFGIHNGAAEFSVTGPAVTIGVHTAILWTGTEGRPRIVIDGGATTTGASGITTNPRAAGSDFRLGSAGASTTLPFDGGISAFIVGEATATETLVTGWNSEGALRDLALNPWALWEDEIDFGFAAVGGAAFNPAWARAANSTISAGARVA